MKPGAYGPLDCGCVLYLFEWDPCGPLLSALDGAKDCPHGRVDAEDDWHKVEEFFDEGVRV